ncbi:MAG: alternative oxidase [bacterium]|nr:alternative oxidase [bacterium]
MELKKGDVELETLNKKLNGDVFLNEYKAKYDNYKVSLLPKVLGAILVFAGRVVYGKNPSYLKFRAVEIIARVPYQSWSSAAYTLLTLFFKDENKALELSEITKFSRLAHDNETMHVVVISHLCQTEHKRVSWFRNSFIPMLFSFLYFWMSYSVYLINRKWSYEINYLFENHAFEQYTIFLHRHKDILLNKKVESRFLDWYGRKFDNQYDFFMSIRNDEIIHRNVSIEQIEKIQKV